MKTHRPRIGKKYMGVLTGAVRRLMSVESDSIKLTDREMADAVNTAREKNCLSFPEMLQVMMLLMREEYLVRTV